MKKLRIEPLRRIAWIGLAVVLCVDATLSARTAQGWGLGIAMLLVCPVAAALVSLALMPGALGALVRRTDLLVPLALATVAGHLLDWLSAAPVVGALLCPAMPVRLLNLSFSLSLGFLLRIALGVVYAAWATRLLLGFVETGTADCLASFPDSWRLCWRVLGAGFIGWAVVLLGTAMFLLLMPALMFVALILLALFGVAWNLATAAVLPLLCAGQGRLWQDFREAMAVGWSHRRRWWFLLLAQMLLLGFIFIFVGGRNFSFSVNVFWTGGYEDGCRWYGKLAEVLGCERVVLVDSVLTCLFGAFAVAIKLAIIQRLQPTSSPDAQGGVPEDLPPGERGGA